MSAGESDTSSNSTSSAGVTPQFQTIPVDRIDHAAYQIRTVFDADSLRELADSMKEAGLLQPIVVRPMADRFQVVAGERRLAAAKLLGWTTIAAHIQEISELDAALRGVIENEQRGDVNPIQRARAFKRLNEPPFGLSQDEIAKRVGFSARGIVSSIIALLDEPSEIQEMLARANISPRHVRALHTIEDESERIELARQAAKEQWSVRETEKRVRKAAKRRAAGKSGALASGKVESPAKAASGWQLVQRVLQVLRAIPLVQRLIARALPLLERFVTWTLERASRLIPGHENKQLESGPGSREPPDSNSTKAA